MDIFVDFDISFDEGYYTGIPAADGSIDIFSGSTIVDRINPDSSSFLDGDLVIHSPNVDGGEDILVNGKLVNHTQPNVFDGEDIYEGTEVKHTTIPNVHGGVDIYGENFQHEGTTLPNVYGSEDYFNSNGNADEILTYSDPLRQIQSLRFDPFVV